MKQLTFIKRSRSETFYKCVSELLNNQKGIGLITAIFTIVILAFFALLVVRYTTTSQISSAEDYIWAQGLYSVEAAAKLQILHTDNGGNWAGGFVFPAVSGIPTQTVGTNPPENLGGGSRIRVQTNHPTNITRTIEVKFVL